MPPDVRSAHPSIEPMALEFPEHGANTWRKETNPIWAEVTSTWRRVQYRGESGIGSDTQHNQDQ